MASEHAKRMMRVDDVIEQMAFEYATDDVDGTFIRRERPHHCTKALAIDVRPSEKCLASYVHKTYRLFADIQYLPRTADGKFDSVSRPLTFDIVLIPILDRAPNEGTKLKLDHRRNAALVMLTKSDVILIAKQMNTIITDLAYRSMEMDETR